MNLKKTLGSVLLAAALVASGFAGARPVQAATTGFVKPLILDKCVLPVQSNEGDSVTFKLQATDPSGKRTVKDGIVQFRLWVENLSTKEWTEVSKGYTSPILLGKEQAITVSGLKAGDYKTVAWVRYASAASAFAAFDAEHATYRTGTLTVKVADAYAQLLQKATDAVTAYETAASKIDKTNPTQAQIDAAKAVATIDLTGLKDADKTPLQARIAAADKVVADAASKMGTNSAVVTVKTLNPSFPFKDVTVSSTTVTGAVSYQLLGANYGVTALGTATRIAALNGMKTIDVNLLDATGKVIGNGTIDVSADVTAAKVNVTSNVKPVVVTATATVKTLNPSFPFKDVTVTLSDSTLKYQITGASYAVTASGTATRIAALNGMKSVNINILAADGKTVLKTATLDVSADVTNVALTLN